MYITVDKKVISIDEERTEEEIKRLRRFLRAQEKKLKEIEADKKRRGYCPDCHILLTIHHRCSKCGIIWNFYKTHH